MAVSERTITPELPEGWKQIDVLASSSIATLIDFLQKTVIIDPSSYLGYVITPGRLISGHIPLSIALGLPPSQHLSPGVTKRHHRLTYESLGKIISPNFLPDTSDPVAHENTAEIEAKGIALGICACAILSSAHLTTSAFVAHNVRLRRETVQNTDQTQYDLLILQIVASLAQSPQDKIALLQDMHTAVQATRGEPLNEWQIAKLYRLRAQKDRGEYLYYWDREDLDRLEALEKAQDLSPTASLASIYLDQALARLQNTSDLTPFV